MLDAPFDPLLDARLRAPVLASLESDWAGFADTRGTAMALREDIGQFASPAGPLACDNADFVALVRSRSAPSILLQEGAIAVPEALRVIAEAQGVQMVLDRPVEGSADLDVLTLGPKDGAEMLDLVQLTKPGPFERNTYLLGDFIGLRRDGRLIAMAGQRMAFPGWREISAVCVHPEFRGRGLAQGLVTEMVRRIGRTGRRAFLHTYADNLAAIRLYQSLGFDIRAEMNMAVVH